MPPRYAYWTILIGDEPTAFRASALEDIMPTLNQLKAKQPTAVLKWFQNGKLWASRIDAREFMENRSSKGKRRDPRESGGGWRGKPAIADSPTPKPAAYEKREPRPEWKPKSAARPEWKSKDSAPYSGAKPAWKPRGATGARPSTGKPEWRPKGDSAERGAKPEWKPKGAGFARGAKPEWKPKGAGFARGAKPEWKPKAEGSARSAKPDWKPRSGEKPEWKPKASARPAAEPTGRPDTRDKKWRPGGDHQDPRQKYKDAKKAKWTRFKQAIRARTGHKKKPE